MLMLGSTCFGPHYAHHQELTTIVLVYHIGRLVLELLLVGGYVQAGWMSVRIEGCNSLRSGHVVGFYSSVIKMMHGPIHIKFTYTLST